MKSLTELFRRPQFNVPLQPESTFVADCMMPSRIIVVVGVIRAIRSHPGETVTISSYEDFVFTRDAIHAVFPGCDLMALITPTTTMMREGIMQSATKVDSGWSGTLNWGLRNSSIRDFVLGYCEPIFKLTI